MSTQKYPSFPFASSDKGPSVYSVFDRVLPDVLLSEGFVDVSNGFNTYSYSKDFNNSPSKCYEGLCSYLQLLGIKATLEIKSSGSECGSGGGYTQYTVTIPKDAMQNYNDLKALTAEQRASIRGSFSKMQQPSEDQLEKEIVKFKSPSSASGNSINH